MENSLSHTPLVIIGLRSQFSVVKFADYLMAALYSVRAL